MSDITLKDIQFFFFRSLGYLLILFFFFFLQVSSFVFTGYLFSFFTRGNDQFLYVYLILSSKIWRVRLFLIFKLSRFTTNLPPRFSPQKITTHPTFNRNLRTLSSNCYRSFEPLYICQVVIVKNHIQIYIRTCIPVPGK